MHEVLLLNLETGKRFVKTFESLFLCKKFVKKCKYSRKVLVLAHPNFD